MKNYYKDKYPNAWQDWLEYSKDWGISGIDYKHLVEWAINYNVFAVIIQFPDFYQPKVSFNGISKIIGDYDEWFDAVDAVSEEVMKRVEESLNETITEIIDLSEVSKMLDIDLTFKEDILAHYRHLILEIGETTKDMLKSVSQSKELGQEDVDRLDMIIMTALACKRLIL